MSKELLLLPVFEILSLYQRKKLSPVEVTNACLKQILKYNPVLNAFSFLDEKHALHQAKGSEKRWMRGQPIGALDGIPATIKDWFHHKGWPTRYGSTVSSAVRQVEDSPPVARMEEQGAIFIGKTTLPEYGHKGVCHSPLTGITRNPWNMAKTSGGSSGGAAVAAAAGMGFLNLGSDAGGSVRIPASFSGVVGFKPSPGLVPSWPASLFASLSSAGPITRCVEDAAMMADILMLPDLRDWNATPYQNLNLQAALKKTVPRLRIAYATKINGVSATSAVIEAMKPARKLLETLGDVNDIALHVPHVVDVFNKHWSAVASLSVTEFNTKQKSHLDPRYLLWASRGDALSLHDYMIAQQTRFKIGETFKALTDSYDIIVTPATAMTAFDVSIDMPAGDKGKPWDDWAIFTYPANLSKLPAISIPAGLDKTGLPVGLQIMAGFMKDALVLQAAKKIEDALAFKPWLAMQG